MPNAIWQIFCKFLIFYNIVRDPLDEREKNSLLKGRSNVS